MSVARCWRNVHLSQNFEHLLDAEAKDLTEVGNAFHIRHFETDTASILISEYNEFIYSSIFLR